MTQAKHVAVLSDHPFLRRSLGTMVSQNRVTARHTWSWYRSPESAPDDDVPILDLSCDWNVLRDADVVISLHCKQLFPRDLVAAVRCVNVHPGLNPYNRGWTPHVFSLVNGLPAGATIHEIDAEIDHGATIVQQEVPVLAWDDSRSLYARVLETELALLDRHLESVVQGDYVARALDQPGNLNFKRDYEALCQLDLTEVADYQSMINRLRALSHGGYRNAYYLDPGSGRRIYLTLSLEPGPERG